MARKKPPYNRQSQDVGNIIALEHVNVTVPDQGLATYFYVNGLGLTRDPYIDFGPANVWINAGKQQFHLPTNNPQVLRGHVGMVVPDLDDLERRLSHVRRRLERTCFALKRRKGYIDVTCPWGNHIRCHGPGGFGPMKLGIPYIQFDVPAGAAEGVARFYTSVFNVPARAKGGLCEVSIGTGQALRFRESKKTIPDYDGHHIAIYLTDFSGPWQYLKDKGLITEESDAHQYRFQQIIDPGSGKPLFIIEHEVRSLYHPMYNRPLVNRNPVQTLSDYREGRDAFTP